jgi:ABC-2 type transport system permease protein
MMWRDNLRGIFYIALKDLRAYYLKPPNISWGIIFPFALILAFTIRQPGEVSELLPGLLGMTLLFGTTSMEAIVITFERRVGALERLLLAPVSLPALLMGKIVGGMAFGLVTTIAVLAVAGLAPSSFLPLMGHEEGANWPLLLLTLFLSAAAFSALGAFVSVAVQEVFEAQTLANFIRFPMIFLGGVFVPLSDLPSPLRVVARTLPLTYAVEAMQGALTGAAPWTLGLDLLILTAFTMAFFGLAVMVLTRKLD